MRLSRLDQSLGVSRRGPFLSPPDGETGGTPDAASAEKSDANGKPEAAEKAFAPILSEADLTAYKVDLRKNIKSELDADLRKSIKAEMDAQRIKDEDAARKQKDLDDATARGEFETVKLKLETDLKTASDEVTQLKTEAEQLRTALGAGLADGWASLPETVRKLGERQHAETDVIGRFTFLHDPDTQALVRELTKGEGATGNGRDPKPGGEGQLTDEAKRKAQAAIYTRF